MIKTIMSTQREWKENWYSDPLSGSDPLSEKKNRRKMHFSFSSIANIARSFLSFLTHLEEKEKWSLKREKEGHCPSSEDSWLRWSCDINSLGEHGI